MIVKSKNIKENNEECLILDMCSESGEILKRYFYYYRNNLIENIDIEESYISGIIDLPDILKLMYDLGKNHEEVYFENQ